MCVFLIVSAFRWVTFFCYYGGLKRSHTVGALPSRPVGFHLTSGTGCPIFVLSPHWGCSREVAWSAVFVHDFGMTSILAKWLPQSEPCWSSKVKAKTWRSPRRSLIGQWGSAVKKLIIREWPRRIMKQVPPTHSERLFFPSEFRQLSKAIVKFLVERPGVDALRGVSWLVKGDVWWRVLCEWRGRIWNKNLLAVLIMSACFPTWKSGNNTIHAFFVLQFGRSGSDGLGGVSWFWSGRKRGEEVYMWMTKKGLWNKYLLLILSASFTNRKSENETRKTLVLYSFNFEVQEVMICATQVDWSREKGREENSKWMTRKDDERIYYSFWAPLVPPGSRTNTQYICPGFKLECQELMLCAGLGSCVTTQTWQEIFRWSWQVYWNLDLAKYL